MTKPRRITEAPLQRYVPPPTWPHYETKPGIPSIAHALPDYHVVAMHPYKAEEYLAL